MGLINWDTIKPQPGAGPELASITNLLSAFADRRMKAQQFQQEQERLQAAQESEAQHRQAIEANARQQLSLQKESIDAEKLRWKAQDDERRQTHQEQARQHFATILPQAQAALAAGDYGRYRELMVAAGATEVPPDSPAPPSPAPQPQQAPPQPMAPPAPQGRAAIEPPPFVPQSPGVFPGGQPPPPPAAPAAPPAPAPPFPPPPGEPGMTNTTEDVLKPLDAPMRWRTPVGSVLDVDPRANEAARRFAREQKAKAFVAALTPHAHGPFAQQAMEETVGAMTAPTWDEKEDPYKLFTARQKELEGMAAADRRAAMMSTQRGAHQETGENFRGLTTLRQDLRQLDAQWNLKADTKDFQEVNKALKLIDTKSGPAQATAIESLIRLGRGGAVTAASQQFIASHMAGGWPAFLDAVEKIKSGQYSDPSVAAAKETLVALRDQILSEVGEKHQEFFGTYLKDPQYAPMRANLESEHDKRFGIFGFKVKRSGAAGIDYTGKKIKGETAPAPEDDPRMKLLEDLRRQRAQLEEQLNSLGAQ